MSLYLNVPDNELPGTFWYVVLKYEVTYLISPSRFWPIFLSVILLAKIKCYQVQYYRYTCFLACTGLVHFFRTCFLIASLGLALVEIVIIHWLPVSSLLHSWFCISSVVSISKLKILVYIIIHSWSSHSCL